MFKISLNNSKKIIMILVFFFAILFSTNVMASSNYTININTGNGSKTGFEPNKNSYWLHGSQQGLRITLVYSEPTTINGRKYLPGDRVFGSVSMDYTELKNIDHYSSVAAKNSKLEHLTSGLNSLSDLKKGGYIYKKLPVSLPTFIYTGIGRNTIAKDVLYKYFEDNYLIKTNNVKSVNYSPVNNLVSLLKDLNAPIGMINDLLSSAKCVYEDNCPGLFEDMKEEYNFALIIEPVGFFYFERNNKVYNVAATSTELGKIFPKIANAGFAAGASHRNIPKSIYLSSNEFGDRLTTLPITTLNKVNNASSFVTGKEMSSNIGLGVGVIKIWDKIEENEEPKKTNKCTPKISCQNGVCDDPTKPTNSVYKDDEDWECIVNSVGTSNNMKVAGIGNEYCPVFCREDITTSFPRAVEDLVVGTKFSFEPISLTSSKECRAEVDLELWRNRYKTANDDALSKYKIWRTEVAKQEAWNNKTDVGACTTSYRTKPTGEPFNPTAFKCDDFPITTKVRVSYTPVDLGEWSSVYPSEYKILNTTCQIGGSEIERVENALKSEGFLLTSKVQDNVVLYTAKNNVSSRNVTFTSVKRPENFTCMGYELAPRVNQQLQINNNPVRWLAGIDVNGELKCQLYEQVKEESTNRMYEYTYMNYSEGTSETVKSCARPKNRTVATRGDFNTAFDLISGYESSLRECSAWNTAYDQNPVLQAVQTQTVKNVLITDRYDLISTKTETNVVPKTMICNNTNLCNSGNIVKYSFNLTKYGFSNVGFNSTGIKLVHKIADSKTFRFDFSLRPEINRFILTPTGEYVNELPEAYKTEEFAGAYKDTKFPGFVIKIDADDTKEGTITINYKNIGENGKFDSCLNRNSQGFATYTCPYKIKTPPPPGCIANCNKLVNVIYRPIDLNSPFAAWDGEGREPGYNWRYEPEIDLVEKFITNNRGVKTDDVYKLDPMYVIDFTGSKKFMINEIRAYNKKYPYDYFPITCKDGKECKSTFLRSNLKDVVKGCGVSDNWNACEGVGR